MATGAVIAVVAAVTLSHPAGAVITVEPAVAVTTAAAEAVTMAAARRAQVVPDGTKSGIALTLA